MFPNRYFGARYFANAYFGNGGTSGGIGPTPDVTNNDRRRIGAFVKRGGVGRLRRT